MTKQAFTYAAGQVAIPGGRVLWLYGDSTYNEGEVYSPYAWPHILFEKKGWLAYSDPLQVGRDYDGVILLAPKQAEEAQGLLALAMERSRGVVMALAANDAGGKRLAEYFQACGVSANRLAKDHCQIVWTSEANKAQRAPLAARIAELAPRQIAMDGANWWTVPGLFSWDRVDDASRLLAENLPDGLAGKAADIGCGWGYLSAKLADYPAIRSVDAFDVDARACDAARKNLPEKVSVHWRDICRIPPEEKYDVIVMNPPFHTGKQEDLGLGAQFIRTAWDCLKPGGRLYLVANRTLPYERVVEGLHVFYDNDRFKCLMGCK